MDENLPAYDQVSHWRTRLTSAGRGPVRAVAQRFDPARVGQLHEGFLPSMRHDDDGGWKVQATGMLWEPILSGDVLARVIDYPLPVGDLGWRVWNARDWARSWEPDPEHSAASPGATEELGPLDVADLREYDVEGPFPGDEPEQDTPARNVHDSLRAAAFVAENLSEIGEVFHRIGEVFATIDVQMEATSDSVRLLDEWVGSVEDAQRRLDARVGELSKALAELGGEREGIDAMEERIAELERRLGPDRPKAESSLSLEGMTDAEASLLREIVRERRRQVQDEGFTVAFDDAHVNGELAWAAAAYAVGEEGMNGGELTLWPSDWEWRRSLGEAPERRYAIAGALLLAESTRLAWERFQRGGGFSGGE